MWFQLFDRIEDRQAAIEIYSTAKQKIAGKYPAKIYKDSWVWVLINKRFEIRLSAGKANKAYQNTDKLVEFIKKFDLKGLENYKGSKLRFAGLKKFIPQLPDDK
jgi:hypothetical protein